MPVIDLVSLKVSHDFGAMEEGDIKILTLRDSQILDNEGKQCFTISLIFQFLTTTIEDELQNVKMAESEQMKKNSDLKTKSQMYTGYDDDEFLTPRTMQSILAKYNEDIDSVGQAVFHFGSRIMDNASKIAQAELESGPIAVNTPLLPIDYTNE